MGRVTAVYRNRMLLGGDGRLPGSGYARLAGDIVHGIDGVNLARDVKALPPIRTFAVTPSAAAAHWQVCSATRPLHANGACQHWMEAALGVNAHGRVVRGHI